MMTALLRATAIAGLLSFSPSLAAGVPAFARQTGQSCSACHFQHFPILTTFGETFKSGNYALMGGQSMVEGDILSIPAVLNLSMILKMKYVKTDGRSGDGTDKGEFQMPDEANVLIGGRVGRNIGFLIEGQLADKDSPVFASFKLPIGFEMFGGRFAFVPFSTDGLGTPFGFELLSTGAVRNVRSFEDRAVTSAHQYVVGGSDEGVAEGVALVYSGAKGFANFTMWTPHHGTVALDRPAYYWRVAATPRLGAWSFGAGMQWWGGLAATLDQRISAVAFDLQAHGETSGLPLGLYASYARAPGSTPGAPSADRNFFNLLPETQEAFAIAAEVGVLPRRVTVGAAYRDARNGLAALQPPSWPPPYGVAGINRNVDRAMTASLTIMMAQNVELHTSYSEFFGSAWTGRRDDHKVSVTLFAAF
jgi:hypothetical protein